MITQIASGSQLSQDSDINICPENEALLERSEYYNQDKCASTKLGYQRTPFMNARPPAGALIRLQNLNAADLEERRRKQHAISIDALSNAKPFVRRRTAESLKKQTYKTLDMLNKIERASEDAPYSLLRNLCMREGQADSKEYLLVIDRN